MILRSMMLKKVTKKSVGAEDKIDRLVRKRNCKIFDEKTQSDKKAISVNVQKSL